MPVAPLPKALLFDVFGTCVDWRTGITKAGEALGQRLGLPDTNWAAFADAWRAQYQPQLTSVRSGARPWTRLEILNRESLDTVLADFGLQQVPATERDAFNLAWRHLLPWPDTVAGLHRLKTRFILAPNSNADIALAVHMAKFANLPWDVILGAEVAQHYKPQPEAYLRSVAALGLTPHEVLMVAAHNEDLVAAGAQGLQTAFVARPLEHGPGQTADLHPAHAFTYIAHDLHELAAQLGA
ncbi:haloacid dehalogenase type II [Hymenobacter profundi]|uniref:Haloacid dehalogenase type II n=1 Tax=Hymenobacter profundi TaxID=1982110 RepID=A0ABS6X4G1_9BACT|nr:haloacid dehalogenase type II [Hymenobacter profundi]MBW3130716.1 haloacid dehalogenase type II [Hymenobacter profundi]